MARKFIRRPLQSIARTATPAERAASQAAAYEAQMTKLRALVDSHEGADIDVSDFSVAAVDAAIAYAQERGLVAVTATVKRRVMLSLA